MSLITRQLITGQLLVIFLAESKEIQSKLSSTVLTLW